MTPFRIFFEDGCAVTATWRSTITDTEQVNGRNKLTGGTSQLKLNGRIFIKLLLFLFNDPLHVKMLSLLKN
jgi:hypothetical protein